MEPGRPRVGIRGSWCRQGGRLCPRSRVGDPTGCGGKLKPSVHSNAGPWPYVSSHRRGSEEDEQSQPEADSSSGRGERFPPGLVSPPVTRALGLTGVEPASVLQVLPVLCADLKPRLHLSTFFLPLSSSVLVWSHATVTKASDEVSAGLTGMW